MKVANRIFDIFLENLASVYSGNEGLKRKQEDLVCFPIVIKTYAVAVGILSLATLYYSIPALSVWGIAFGITAGVYAYDEFKISANLKNNPSVFVDIEHLKKIRRPDAVSIVEQKCSLLWQGTFTKWIYETSHCKMSEFITE